MKYDYLKQVLKVLGLAIVLLLLIGLIPDIKFEYKQFNLLSDLLKTESDTIEVDSLQNIADLTTIDEETQPVSTTDEIPATDTPAEEPVEEGGVVSIEDFSPDKQLLKPFFAALKNEVNKRTVRIGVIGDSFIEGDILTAELRKQLQTMYGGAGVGYIPIISPTEECRKRIKQTTVGWTGQSMVYYKKADWSKFTLAGFYYRPSEDATVELRIKTEERAKQISFYFINEKNTKVSVQINDGAYVDYTPQSSKALQSLTWENENLTSIKVKVSKVDGFTGIGFYLNDATGVYVDNFSVRGSSGSVMVTLNKELSEQLSEKVPYDLLVIQYGLNVMSAEQTTYGGYKRLMVGTINHLKECYPGVPLLVISVGDRGSKGASGITTHPGIPPLITAQRQFSKDTGIAFWNTFEAMGGENSMVEFVKHTPPLAGKDYTHINFLGGNRIGEQLFKSLMKEQKQYTAK